MFGNLEKFSGFFLIVLFFMWIGLVLEYFLNFINNLYFSNYKFAKFWEVLKFSFFKLFLKRKPIFTNLEL